MLSTVPPARFLPGPAPQPKPWQARQFGSQGAEFVIYMTLKDR